MNRKLRIDGSRLFIAFGGVGLRFFTDGACWGDEVERGLKTAAIGTAVDLVKGAEQGAAERRSRMIAPLGERGFSPEVESVDVAVREVHRTLVRLVVVLTRVVRRHRKPARDDR